MYDLVFRGGEIIDGSGSSPFTADVAVTGKRIVAVGSVGEGNSHQAIDARGLVVAPGFIDMHSHSDLTLRFDPQAKSKIKQGVTTEVVGQCGVSCAPVRRIHKKELLRQFETNNFMMTDAEVAAWNWLSEMDYMNELVGKGISSNLIPLVGSVPLRIAAVGMAESVEPSELAMMKELLEEEFARDIWGMSSGLYYVPGSHFTSAELTSLCVTIAEHNGIWAVHMRDEGQMVFEAVDEVLDIAKKSGVSLQIAHLKLEGNSNWGKAEHLLAKLYNARKDGVDVSWDQYPYTAYGSGLIDVVPPALRSRGIKALLDRIGDKAVRESLRKAVIHGTDTWRSPFEEIEWERVMVSEAKNDGTIVGKTIREIADMWRRDPDDTIVELLVTQDGSVKVVVPAMSEDDVKIIMRDDATMISSDGKAISPEGRYAQLHPHPRYYGAFPRVLARYVREEGILDLTSAIFKMTGLPASRLGLEERGTLEVGKAADIVVLDPRSVQDRATYEHPHQFPDGIEYVVVNGRVVIKNGQHTGTYPGRLLAGM